MTPLPDAPTPSWQRLLALSGVVFAVLAWFAWRSRVWGWLAGTASLLLLGGAISTVWAAGSMVIMWDGFDEERGLPIGGMEVPEPSWGLALIGLAAVALAIGAIIRLLAHPGKAAGRTPRGRSAST